MYIHSISILLQFANLVTFNLGWPRVIAKNGLYLLDDWEPNLLEDFLLNQTVVFDYYPDSPQGDLYRYYYGRLRITIPGIGDRFLEIGNVSSIRLHMILPLSFSLTQSHPPLILSLSAATRRLQWLRAIPTNLSL